MDENIVLSVDDSSGEKNEMSQVLIDSSDSSTTVNHSDDTVDDKQNDIDLAPSMTSYVNLNDDTSTTPFKTNENETIVNTSVIFDEDKIKIPSVDDTKLVKFSLPTNSINSINIIQSNTQFLNKSRNFLNFITEKSTNIMEKALLPQHIASRYNGLDKNPRIIQDSTNNFENNVLSKKSDSFNSINDTTDDSMTLLTNECIPSNDTPVLSQNSCLSVSNGHCNDEKEIPHVTQGSNVNGTNLFEDNDHDHDGGNDDEDDEVTIENYKKLKIHNLSLLKKLETLEEKNKELELQINPVDIENREKTIERLTNELRLALATNEDLRRNYNSANKERESMVMKYAVGEKQLIDTQRLKDSAEKKVKELSRDNENFQLKLKQLQGERTRICGILDTKCRELIDAQKDIEKYKEDCNVKDVKLKWLQNKLKNETDIQKDIQQKLDNALLKINQMKNECDNVKKESFNSIIEFQKSEENKAVTLDEQLKEQQARLILERHVTEDKENLRIALEKQVDVLNNRQQLLIEENNNLIIKINDYEKNHSTYESNYDNLKQLADKRLKEINDLMTKVSQIETLKLQLIHKDQCLASIETEVERLRLSNQEMQNNMECCRQREAHMLEFTQKLTDKNVRLQSEFSSIEAKSNQLEIEQGPLRKNIIELNETIKQLDKNFNIEKNKRIEECELLAKHLAEQKKLSDTLNRKYEDSQGEIIVLKRKYQMSMKELSRELQQCRKKIEQYESKLSNDNDKKLFVNSNGGVSSGENSTSESPIAYNDLDKNSLIEKILKMQRVNVKRAEKIDFLEENSRAQLAELQKKNKIIQNYILHENFDAMGNSESDRYKAQLARHGGIMASVFNHRVSDNNMTLELSLEINQKLQAVLEDALLKNITLKDNIDTLGEEIARLSMKNQQLLKTTTK
ncbi:coiled-coil domain-containing protein 186 isoform X2 [Aphidius gifuensis]|uniref:coiled-coil domain-containing protein 186 isoform X2 n=1 Tax=Aphidius gifuensis TaxID=684658 RepID=UPI001CDCB13E|nr:coiled-coil domain-containing protein 186 isoform X2 [Aphidius gifuensis]